MTGEISKFLDRKHVFVCFSYGFSICRNWNISFLNFMYLFMYLFLLFFKYNCLHFPPPPSCPTHHHLSPSNLPLLALPICPLYLFLDGPSPINPNYPLSPSSVVTVGLFFISMSVVVFCLLVCFVDWVPLTGEIIWKIS